jgi:hypothetical protein
MQRQLLGEGREEEEQSGGLEQLRRLAADIVQGRLIRDGADRELEREQQEPQQPRVDGQSRQCLRCGSASKGDAPRASWHRHPATGAEWLCHACFLKAAAEARQQRRQQNRQQLGDVQGQVADAGDKQPGQQLQPVQAEPQAERQCLQCGSASKGSGRWASWHSHPATGDKWLCQPCFQAARTAVKRQQREKVQEVASQQESEEERETEAAAPPAKQCTHCGALHGGRPGTKGVNNWRRHPETRELLCQRCGGYADRHGGELPQPAPPAAPAAAPLPDVQHAAATLQGWRHGHLPSFPEPAAKRRKVQTPARDAAVGGQPHRGSRRQKRRRVQPEYEQQDRHSEGRLSPPASHQPSDTPLPNAAAATGAAGIPGERSSGGCRWVGARRKGRGMLRRRACQAHGRRGMVARRHVCSACEPCAPHCQSEPPTPTPTPTTAANLSPFLDSAVEVEVDAPALHSHCLALPGRTVGMCRSKAFEWPRTSLPFAPVHGQAAPRRPGPHPSHPPARSGCCR